MVPPWTQQSQRCITQWQSYVEIGNFKKKLGFFCMWSSIYICVTCMILCMISSHNNICLFIAIHTRLNMLTKKTPYSFVIGNWHNQEWLQLSSSYLANSVCHCCRAMKPNYFSAPGNLHTKFRHVTESFLRECIKPGAGGLQRTLLKCISYTFCFYIYVCLKSVYPYT